MADAEVGDDVLDGDPTVRRLEDAVAELLGKERALFFPSGTMANQTAVWLLARRGTEILLDADAHIVHWEMAGAAALSGAQIRPVRGSGGVIDAASVRAAVRPPSSSAPAASLVCLENTHNGAGGRVTPLGEMRALRDAAREHSLPVHLDGARLWNATVASQTPLREFAACADTVMVSFSKGLGAPVGAALVGSDALMREGWIARKRFGGGMRQSGILAAAALYGLQENFGRLLEDHRNARLFAQAVDGVGGARVVPPDTNIVMIDIAPLESGEAPGAGSGRVSGIITRAREAGVLFTPWSATRMRAVTHLDVSEAAVRRAADVLTEILESVQEPIA